ncbi:MAG: FeoA domain-containing protein [Verrucomicrobiales bacterium]
MVDPLAALLGAAGVLGALVLFFRPGKGVFWQWRRAFQNTGRVLIENALKILYDCEYRQLPCTLQSLSGGLAVSSARAIKLLSQLEALDLAILQGSTLQLTDEGRSYALRIVRIHRVWERYLADETGVPAPEWHAEAEQQEHRMTLREANALAAKLGNPLYDPHGDPIPTALGELPPSEGVAMTDLQKGQTAEIVHIEDEPEEIYAQLVAQGFDIGMHIHILDITPVRIRFSLNGEEQSLGPVCAANVTVSRLAKESAEEGRYPTLSLLQPGESGRVVGISPACRGLQRRRLMDLGVIEGTRIEAEMRSAAGDPTAYEIRGATIALRKQQADLIYIQHEN